MTPKARAALEILNTAFESHDAAPVMQAIITQADYRMLFEALAETPSPEDTAIPKDEIRYILDHGIDDYWITLGTEAAMVVKVREWLAGLSPQVIRSAEKNGDV